MSVAGILRTKGASVITIRSYATIRELVRGLRDEGIGAMVVCNDGRTILGIITERDVVRALADRGATILDTSVSDLMTRQVTTCTPQDSVKHVMGLMTTHRIRHVPVVDGGRLAGMVSIGDVVKNRLEEMETEANVLREAYIAGERRAPHH
jgi:CBS domain-containing protein